MPGTYVINISVAIIRIRKGMIPLITLSNVVSPTRDATKRFTPSGGVMKPIARLTTMMIPKWIGSTPREVTTGNRMGARIIIAHSVSMKQPTIRSNRLISNRIRIALSVRDSIPDATVAGIRPSVRTLEKPAAQPITIRMEAVVSQAFLVTFSSFFKSSSL